MLYVFGDSWGYGAELKPGEKPFAHALSIHLKHDYTNLSREGTSLGDITAQVLSNVNKMTDEDYVVVIVPPDTRWYKVTDTFHVQTITLHNKEYRNLIMHYNIPWFIYHHNLFMYTIISAVTSKTKKLILAHNYGNLVIIDMFKNLINMNYFLSQHSLTRILSGTDWDNNYRLDIDGPQSDSFKGIYFNGNISHPNLLGHKEIARLLYEKFNTK